MKCSAWIAESGKLAEKLVQKGQRGFRGIAPAPVVLAQKDHRRDRGSPPQPMQPTREPSGPSTASRKPGSPPPAAAC